MAIVHAMIETGIKPDFITVLVIWTVYLLD